FRRAVAREMHRESVPGPSHGVLDVFAAHSWPGNVRELEQVIRRTIIDSGSLVDAEAAQRALRSVAPVIPSAVEGPSEVEGPGRGPSEPPPDELVPLDEAERKHIIAVLRATGGNQTQAAYI